MCTIRLFSLHTNVILEITNYERKPCSIISKCGREFSFVIRGPIRNVASTRSLLPVAVFGALRLTKMKNTKPHRIGIGVGVKEVAGRDAIVHKKPRSSPLGLEAQLLRNSCAIIGQLSFRNGVCSAILARVRSDWLRENSSIQPYSVY